MGFSIVIYLEGFETRASIIAIMSPARTRPNFSPRSSQGLTRLNLLDSRENTHIFHLLVHLSPHALVTN